MSCRGSPASSRAPQFHRALRRDNGQVVQPFMRVGTYPTRDFATLGILLLPNITILPFPIKGKFRMGKLGGPVISAVLCMSPYRSDHIFSTVPFAEFGVWSLRIPGTLLPLGYKLAGGLCSPAYLDPNSQLDAEFTLRRAAQDLG